MTSANERGSVLVLVLAVVAVLGVIGAGLSRGAHARWAAARDYGLWACEDPIRKSTTGPGWPDGVTPCDYRERRVMVVVTD